MIETAFLSLSKLRICHLVEKKVKGALHLQNLKEDMHQLIITILIGNNLVNVGASALATSISLEFIGSWGVSVATGLMTLIILVFGEVTPKSFAMLHSEKICFKTAKLMGFLKIFFYPLIWILDNLSKIITNRDKHDNGQEITTDELRSIINMGEESGSIEKEEREMIQNIFKLDEITVGEVMTPRTDMFSLDCTNKVFEVLKELMSKKFSRIPLYEGNNDNIIGIVHIRDILNAITENMIDATLKDIMTEVRFIPDSNKVDDVLTEFQDKKMQMAIVVDEHGGVAGIVTIEDLLEEIVGEIYDEKDIKEALIRKINKNTYIIKGSARIDEINEKIRSNFQETDLYDTISGMVIDKFDRIPKVGDSIAIKRYKIIVTKATKKRILELKVLKNDKSSNI